MGERFELDFASWVANPIHQRPCLAESCNLGVVYRAVSAFQGGQRQHTLWQPAPAQPAVDRRWVLCFAARVHQPIRHGLCLAPRRNQYGVSPIDRLLVGRRPPAVTWFIIPINVNAIDGVRRRWAISHVCKKIVKVQPSVADLDAAEAVAFIAGHRVTPAPHRHPNPVHVRAAFAVGRMRPSAATRLTITLLERSRPSGSEAATITAAKPALSRHKPNNNQFAESLPDKV